MSVELVVSFILDGRWTTEEVKVHNESSVGRL